MTLKKSRNIEYNKEIITTIVTNNRPLYSNNKFEELNLLVQNFRKKLVDILFEADKKNILIDLYEFNMKIKEEILSFVEYIEDLCTFHRMIDLKAIKETFEEIIWEIEKEIYEQERQTK